MDAFYGMFAVWNAENSHLNISRQQTHELNHRDKNAVVMVIKLSNNSFSDFETLLLKDQPWAVQQEIYIK